MSKYSTAAEDRIREIKEQASLLEQERRAVYQVRLREIVTETCAWDDIPKEEIPMKIAERAYQLGRDFGANKMYEYL